MDFYRVVIRAAGTVDRYNVEESRYEKTWVPETRFFYLIGNDYADNMIKSVEKSDSNDGSGDLSIIRVSLPESPMPHQQATYFRVYGKDFAIHRDVETWIGDSQNFTRQP